MEGVVFGQFEDEVELVERSVDCHCSGGTHWQVRVIGIYYWTSNTFSSPHRVLCVRVRGDLVATGSSDSTIRYLIGHQDTAPVRAD